MKAEIKIIPDDYITKLPQKITVVPNGRELTDEEQDKMMYHFGDDFAWSMSLSDNKIYFGPIEVDDNDEGLVAWGYITVEQLSELNARPKKTVTKKVAPKRSEHLTSQKWYKNLMNRMK